MARKTKRTKRKTTTRRRRTTTMRRRNPARRAPARRTTRRRRNPTMMTPGVKYGLCALGGAAAATYLSSMPQVQQGLGQVMPEIPADVKLAALTAIGTAVLAKPLKLRRDTTNCLYAAAAGMAAPSAIRQVSTMASSSAMVTSSITAPPRVRVMPPKALPMTTTLSPVSPAVDRSRGLGIVKG